MRELESQHDQGHQHAVAEGQPVVGAGSGGTAARMAAAAARRGLVLGGPWVGQLGDEVAKVLPEMPVKQGWDRAARTHVAGRIPA